MVFIEFHKPNDNDDDDNDNDDIYMKFPSFITCRAKYLELHIKSYTVKSRLAH